MDKKKILKYDILSALKQCQGLEFGAVCSKVIAINRKTMEVKLMDEDDSIFAGYEDIYEHPIYDVEYVTSLIDYDAVTGTFSINNAVLLSVVESFFPDDSSFTIEDIINYDDDPIEDLGEFTQEEIDDWYLNQLDDDA